MLFKISFFAFYLFIFQTFTIANEIKEDVALRKDIVYDVADIRTVYPVKSDNTIQLEAFKSSSNDIILSGKNTTEYGKLNWVSLGNPTLVRTPNIRNKNVSNIFHFSTEGFYTYVEMLTIQQRQTILQSIANKYKINVSIDQVVNLGLSRFQCNLNLFSNGIKMVLIGEVTEFQTFPLRMNFWAPINSKERLAFQQRLSDSETEEFADLILGCEIASYGKEMKTNKLSISPNLLNRLDIAEKLFGSANTTYVTRDQMINFATELYTSLNIVEEYQIPMHQFNNDFVTDLISQTAINAFNQISFDDAVKIFSKYSISFDDDFLEIETIKSDIGKIFEVTKSNNFSHIHVNNEFLESLKRKSMVTVSIQDEDVKFLGVIRIGSAIKVCNEKSKEWIRLEKTLNEQLKEINTGLENDIQWRIDGESIVPRTINVARLSRALFFKTLTFNRIRKQFYYDALFQRKLSLYTSKYTNYPLESTSPKLPNGIILAADTKKISSMFDLNGKGTGDYKNFYICDGRNGTPDLRKRFLVGVDDSSRFFQADSTGDLNYVEVKMDNGTMYSIDIHGLTSANDLDSNKAKITYTGDKELKENRPSFYLLTYIIYYDEI